MGWDYFCWQSVRVFAEVGKSLCLGENIDPVPIGRAEHLGGAVLAVARGGAELALTQRLA